MKQIQFILQSWFLLKLEFFIFFFQQSRSLYMAVQYTNMEIV